MTSLLSQPSETDRDQIVFAFHERRIREAGHYEHIVGEFTQLGLPTRTSDELSNRRLLQQPTGYLTLTFLWKTTVDGNWKSKTEPGITAYSLAKHLTTDEAFRKKNQNYVDRVIDAAVFFRLVTVNKSGHKYLLVGSPKLDKMMRKFALRCEAPHLLRLEK